MKLKLNIPSFLKDIRLSQHQRFIKAVKDSEDIEFINRQLVGCMLNVSDDIVKQIPRKDFNEIAETLTTILQEKPKVQTTIYHNGIKYGLIPDMQEMTVGEQADLDSMYNVYDKRDKCMAVLYRPITAQTNKGYLIEDYTGKEEPLDLTLDVVIGVDGFFLSILNDCMNITLNSIERDQEVRKILQSSDTSGDGHKIFMHSLRTLFSDMKQMLHV